MTIMFCPSAFFISCLLLIHRGFYGGAQVASAADTPPPICRFTFTTDECTIGSFTDTQASKQSSSALSRNPISTKCTKGLGVESASHLLMDHTDLSPLSVESSSAKQLFHRVGQNNNGMSFEFWLKPLGKKPQGAISTIFTVGSKDGSTSGGTSSVCDRQFFDLQLLEVDGYFQITFRSSESFFHPCFSFPVFEFPAEKNKLVHIVIALKDGHQQVFFNSKPELAASEPFSNDLRHWGDRSTMHFFTHLGSTTAELWKDSFYQFSVYDQVLSQVQVERSMQRGITGGRPYSLPYQVIVNEDAEEIPRSHDPEWYIRPPVVASQTRGRVKELQRLPVRIKTVEEEIHDLLVFAKLDQTASQVTTQAPLPHYVYITSLPVKGRLYQVIGPFFVELQYSTKPSNKDAPAAILLEDPSSLIYLPPFNDHSLIPGAKFTEISYCVTSHIIFDSAQCESEVITILVEAVNDPPIATTVPDTLTTWEGTDWESFPSLELTGTDVDTEDAIMYVQITEPPRWGSLLLRVTEFRDDGLYHGSVITEEKKSNSLKTINGSIFVKYVFGPSDASIPEQPIPGNDATDHFQFRVVDKKGVWSLSKSVRVDIASALEATSEIFDQSKSQNLISTSILQGEDTSTFGRPLSFFLETVPKPEKGWLSHFATMKQLLAGSTIPADHDNEGHVAISFVPNSNYCNATKPTSTGNFSYRAVALDGAFVVSASPVVAETLEALCYNIPPLEISISSEPLALDAFSLTSLRQVSCGTSLYNFPKRSQECSTTVGFQGINVAASEYQIDPALVTILPGNGFLSFADGFWNHTKPIFGRQSMSSEKVVFEAQPSDLEEILKGLVYQTQSIGEDVISISIQHGNCGGLSIDDTISVSPCQRLLFTIPVHASEGEQDAIYDTNTTSIPFQVWISWIFYPIFYYFYTKFSDALYKILFWCCPCLRFCCRRKAASEMGAAVGPETATEKFVADDEERAIVGKK